MRNLDKAGAIGVTLWATLSPDVRVWTSTADALACAIGDGGSSVETDRPTLKTEAGEVSIFRFARHLNVAGATRADLVLVFPPSYTAAERTALFRAFIDSADQYWPEEKKEETATTEAGE